MMHTILTKNLTDENSIHGLRSVIHARRNVIHGWKCHLWMSSMDDPSICWMEINGWRTWTEHKLRIIFVKTNDCNRNVDCRQKLRLEYDLQVSWNMLYAILANSNSKEYSMMIFRNNSYEFGKNEDWDKGLDFEKINYKWTEDCAL